MFFFQLDNNNTKKKKEIINVNRSQANEKLKNGEYVLKDGTGKANFWKSYKKLYTKDGKDTNCVQCQHCGRFDEYDTIKGLKVLNAHAKSCNAFGMPKIDGYVKREVKVTKSEKDELTKSAVKFCYMDMRPFIAVEGRGLMNLFEAVSTISAKYGKLTADQLKEMLPVANTVINL